MKFVLEKYDKMNFEIETHCLHRLPCWRFQNSATMAKCCHQNVTNICNLFLNFFYTVSVNDC